MKFRAVMYESTSMTHLAFIGYTLAKLTKHCVMRLTKAEMSFLVCEENSSPKQVLVWCLLDARQFFNEFVVESGVPAQEIYLEFPTEMFAISLSSLKNHSNNSRSVKLKLTHKISPCLTVEIEMTSALGTSQSCIHDIPIKVLPKALWNEFSAPPNHQYTTVLELRDLKKMRSGIERLKKLCHFVILKSSSEAGTFTVSTSTPAVDINSIFKNVVITHASGENENEVRVDSKKLCSLLGWEVVNPKRCTCSFLGNELIHMTLACDTFQLHFYLTTIEE